MQISFDPLRKSVFRRENGQYRLYATIFRDVGKTKMGVVDFIYDSGAFLTVINKERYETLGLNSLPRVEHHINGYTGKADGYFFQMPWLRIGGEDLQYVWVFSPKSGDLKQNLLGTNVIERFRVFQDNEDDCFYFLLNTNPRYYTTDSGDSFAGGVPYSSDNKSNLFINSIV
jgi:hypothetical protein